MFIILNYNNIITRPTHNLLSIAMEWKDVLADMPTFKTREKTHFKKPVNKASLLSIQTKGIH